MSCQSTTQQSLRNNTHTHTHHSISHILTYPSAKCKTWKLSKNNSRTQYVQRRTQCTASRYRVALPTAAQASAATRRHFLVWGDWWLVRRWRHLSLSLAWNKHFGVCCKNALLVWCNSGLFVVAEVLFLVWHHVSFWIFQLKRMPSVSQTTPGIPVRM